tara:strand:- start:177 stop:539 length:363 start_codon:yes stop_codon:yes gene_type:complete
MNNNKNNNRWECKECKVITNFKGLCRDCTTYDEDSGGVITPIQRVRINSDGTLWTPPSKGRAFTETKDMIKSMRFMRQKNPSKKQMSLMTDEIKELQEAQEELSNSDAEIIELGEGVEEE